VPALLLCLACWLLSGSSLVTAGKKVLGYTVGTWFVILSALTIAVNSDEDTRARMEDEHPLVLAICDYYASYFERILADDDDEGEEEEDDDDEDDGEHSEVM